MSLFLAADCGGSKTAVAIADASGAIVARATGGPSNISYLAPAEFIANVSAAIALALAACAAVVVLPLVRVLWWAHGHPEPDRLEVSWR